MSKLDELTNVPDLTQPVRKIGGLTIQQVEETVPYLNILIHGDPGVGKTVLAGSADNVDGMSPVLYVDFEGGTLSLRDFYPGVDVVRCQSMGDLQKVYNELLRGNSGYRTVVIDSLTEIQKFSMQQIMREMLEKHPDADPEVPGLREWGKNQEQVRRVVRAFRDLPMHSIFTSLTSETKDPRTGKVTYWPSLPGKLQREVPGYFDCVFYLYTKMKDGKLLRCLLTSSDTYITKDRSNRLPEIVQEATMQELNEKITGTGTGEA